MIIKSLFLSIACASLLIFFELYNIYVDTAVDPEMCNDLMQNALISAPRGEGDCAIDVKYFLKYFAMTSAIFFAPSLSLFYLLKRLR